MRVLTVRVAAVLAMVLLAGEPLTAPAQDQTIRQPGPVRPTLPVQDPGTGRIVVPPKELPPPVVLPTPKLRRLEEAPQPQHFVAPGIQGIYAQLRSFKGRFKDVQLKVYEPYTTPATPPDPSRFNIRQIVIKFIEGSAVRLRDGVLVASDEPAAIETRVRLTRAGLEPAGVAQDLAKLNDVIASFKGLSDRAAQAIDELDLNRLRQAAERSTRFEQPDPNLFYFVHLPPLPPEEAQRVLQTLAKFRSVEVAYFQPIPFDAADQPPTTTLDVFASQGYLRAAPGGIDVDFARNFAGGRGEGVRIADIEGGWDPGHEDLPPVAFGIGVNWGNVSSADGNHGTAVLGELVAEENAFGATGIVPRAQAGWSSVTSLSPFRLVYFYSVGHALLSTGEVLRAGDIALIEQHTPTQPNVPCTCLRMGVCVNTQLGFVAVETFAFEHAAISNLTGAGIIVVEAAGNGETMVTPASTRDSGAIVVGASNAARVPACFTNFGPRVDVHAWGGGVGTLGYAVDFNGAADPTLRANGNDAHQWYTTTFSGTSSAAPIVTGAAALIQSTRIAAGHPPLNSVAMRSLLASTGTPQVPAVRNIGPLPNLRAAIATYMPDRAQFMHALGAPISAVTPGATFNVTVRFKNTGGRPWTGAHVMAIAPTQTGPSAFGTQSIPVGTPSAPVDPNQFIDKVFSLRAPTAPGVYSLGFWLRDPNGAVLATGTSQNIIVGSPPNDTATLTIASTPGQLRMGVPFPVVVTARNTGATTWNPVTHGLRMWTGGNNLMLSQTSLAVSGTIVPGQTQTFTFMVTCRATGIPAYSTQMTGASSAVAGRNVTCVP